MIYIVGKEGGTISRILELGQDGRSATEGEAGVLNNGARKPVVTIIIPTRNEAENVEALMARIGSLPSEQPYEALFIDDSEDGTAEAIRAMSASVGYDVRVIHRPANERNGGLGGAVVRGIEEARGDWICVMDGDLQHPPELVPELLAEAEREGADLVVASRYQGRGTKRNFSLIRELVSRTLILLARFALPGRLGGVSDPLSGFFLVRKDALRLDALQPNGFKILLEILIACPDLKVAEVPLDFGARNGGRSKASTREVLRYVLQLLRLRHGGAVQRFGRFALVGASGLVVNFAWLAFSTEVLGVHYLLSALLATQVSTLWNFTLTEIWVFPDRRTRAARIKRLVAFYAINNAALLLRGPILFALVAGVGIHYLLANLISIGALTIARYILADTWIWRRKPSPDALQHHYDVHGIVTVESDVRLPELEWFRVADGAEQPTIRVRTHPAPNHSPNSDDGVPHLHYSEGPGGLGFVADIRLAETIEVETSAMLRWSPHVLYTNVVEPILRWTFVKRNYALIHGACIANGGDAYLATAKTDTGKTTTVLKVLNENAYSFLSDDLTLLSPDGHVLSYPKPLTISLHTVAAVSQADLSRSERWRLIVQSRVHSRSGRLFANFLARTRLPVATINALIQMIIPPPKYGIKRLIPGVDIGRGAKLRGMFVLERGEGADIDLSHEEALDTLMANTEDAFGFPPYAALEGFLQRSSNGDLRPAERTIVSQGLANCSTRVLRRSSMNWWEDVASTIAAGPPRPPEHLLTGTAEQAER